MIQSCLQIDIKDEGIGTLALNAFCDAFIMGSKWIKLKKEDYAIQKLPLQFFFRKENDTAFFFFIFKNQEFHQELFPEFSVKAFHFNNHHCQLDDAEFEKAQTFREIFLEVYKKDLYVKNFFRVFNSTKMSFLEQRYNILHAVNDEQQQTIDLSSLIQNYRQSDPKNPYFTGQKHKAMSSKLSSTSQAVWKDIAEFRLAYLTGTPDEISCDILSYERLKFRLKEIVIRELFDQNVEDFNLFHQSEVNKLNEYRTAFCYVASCYGSSSIYEKQPEVDIFQPFFTHYYEDLIMRIENFLKHDINKAILAANTFRLTTTVQMNKKKKVNLHENKNETKDELQNRTAIPVPIDTNTSEIDLNGFTDLVILTKDDFLPFTATESDNNPKIKKRKDEEVSSSDDEGGKAPRKKQKVVVTNGKVDPKAKTIGQGVKMISKQNQSTQQSELVNSFSHLELKTPFGSLYKQPSYQAKDQFIAESLALGDMRYFESQSIVTVKSGLLDMFTLFLLFHVHDENGARRFGMTESIKSDDDYVLILLFFMCETSTEDILYFLDNSNTGEKLETCTNNENEEQAEESGEEESDEGGESKDDADDNGGGKGIPQRLFKNAFTGKRHDDVSNKENLSYSITERAQALREQCCRNYYFYLDSNSVSSQPSLNDHSKLTWLLNK